MSFSDSEWAWDTHDRVATRDAWIYQNKEIQKLGRRNIQSVTCENSITPTLLWLVQPGCSRCLLKKAEMLDTRAQ
ncbi:hypothetical protein IGI04_037418 [Brassica rapa subsp. trilocularis]|uniref:Uncharacterized protein n=1 Tax=Brassica rapa subsp. trilocularis TaxID=1813537 RepID=A0ABQ7LK77_BRACM|nr:hypothetical protein IGI04_037418 [Brassica rapa subsp. trilocularis]